MDDLKALSYFSSLSHISRQIAVQKKSLIKYLGNNWQEYTPEQQQELLDDLCVPQHIRDMQPSCADDEIKELPVYWPTLKLESGEKIIVDENDIWTWRDEHSGPFSWRSRSQQDLTLLDFEPDNLTKPAAKSHKSESEEQPPSSPGYQSFPTKTESWTQAVLDDYIEHAVYILTPVHTPLHTASPVESPGEEVNQAFEGSCEDLSPSASPAHTSASIVGEGEEANSPQSNVELEADVHTTKGKSSKGCKSPSPKKILRTGSFTKDGKGKTAGDTGLLISDAKDEGKNAFCNPALESEAEWSNFVGQKSVDVNVTAQSVPRNLVHDVPKNQGQDVPRNPPPVPPVKTARLKTSLPPPPPPPVSHPPADTSVKSVSQQPPVTNPLAHAATSTIYINTDGRINKGIKPEAEPVAAVTEPVTMVMDRGGGRGGDDSVESTPDHTTQLLKPSSATSVIQEAEKEEVLYVVDNGASISMSTQLTGSSSSLNIPKTGFDFLDDW